MHTVTRNTHTEANERNARNARNSSGEILPRKSSKTEAATRRHSPIDGEAPSTRAGNGAHSQAPTRTKRGAGGWRKCCGAISRPYPVKISMTPSPATRTQPRTHVAGNAIKNIWKANTK